MEPKWLKIARSYLGLREYPGSRHNPTIIAKAKALGARILGIAVVDDETPWCGTFAAWCLSDAGIAPPKIAVRAKSWATWGTKVTPCVGAVLVFDRQGGGHVGFYVGETRTTYKVLGGNQGNAVSIVDIAKDRLVKEGARWPSGVGVMTFPNFVGLAGAVSRNEA